MTLEQVILALTPFAVYVVAELVKWLKPRIKGVALLLLTTTASAVIALVTSIVVGPDASFLTQFAVGMLSLVVNQFYKQWQSGN